MKKILLLTLLVVNSIAYSYSNLAELRYSVNVVLKESKTSIVNNFEISDYVFSQNPCRSSLKSLTKYLKKLEEKKAANQVSSGSFKTYIASAERNLNSIQNKCPELDISAEKRQLNVFKKDLTNAGGADGARQASIKKGYYDKAIDNLVAPTHPAYGNFRKAKSNYLVKAFEYYRHKKPAESFKRISEAKEIFSEIKSAHTDVDFSLVDSELLRLEHLLKSESGAEITSKIKNENTADYFRNIHMNLNYVYSDTKDAADVAQGLQFRASHKNLQKANLLFGDFSKENYLKAVEEAKANGSYPSAQFYIEKVVAALTDYPNFITKSSGSFHAYLDNLNTIGIKGDITKELEELDATKLFCELLLKFAPKNPTASNWLKQVNSEIKKRKGSISYASKMHENNVSTMFFSNRQVTIGNESASDFSTAFTSNDNIFATIYLPSKLRKMTDSYAANNMLIKINDMPIAEASMTAIWITTPMQEKNYLQFALLPNSTWLSQYGSYYRDNKLRTHEAIAEQLVAAGSYSNVKVEIIVTFRGTNSKISGSFTIDQSGGIEKLKSSQNKEINARLSNESLPKSGMSNAGLQQQALAIMQKKAGQSSQKYTKAIITATAWDYDKAYTGVVVSRSIVIAMVSKNGNGQCMYQYHNFKQQAQGNGSFSNNLEWAGAGANIFISCDKL